MTSEMENISSAKEIKNTESTLGKPIAVSTSNLTVDASGIAPLEKQTAFVQTQQQTTNEVTETQQSQSVQPTVSEPTNAIAAPGVLQTANAQPQVGTQPQVVTSTPNLQEQPVNGVANPVNLENPISQENIDSINYNKPSQDGILTENPVDVVSGNLGSIDTTGIQAAYEQLTKMPENQEVESLLTKMKTPENNEAVNAVEPTGVNNAMFVNNVAAPVGTVTSEQPAVVETSTPVEATSAVEIPTPAVEPSNMSNGVVDSPFALPGGNVNQFNQADIPTFGEQMPQMPPLDNINTTTSFDTISPIATTNDGVNPTVPTIDGTAPENTFDNSNPMGAFETVNSDVPSFDSMTTGNQNNQVVQPQNMFIPNDIEQQSNNEVPSFEPTNIVAESKQEETINPVTQTNEVTQSSYFDSVGDNFEIAIHNIFKEAEEKVKAAYKASLGEEKTGTFVSVSEPLEMTHESNSNTMADNSFNTGSTFVPPIDMQTTSDMTMPGQIIQDTPKETNMFIPNVPQSAMTDNQVDVNNEQIHGKFI